MSTGRKYWLLTLLGTLAATTYPLYMGMHVVQAMATNGSVPAETFPKYIIPYTPIALAVLVAVIGMPLFFKLAKRKAAAAATLVSIGVFFVAELVLESRVIVTSTVETTLESWQMLMCYVSPENFQTRTWRAVDVLIGEYSPLFKLHFYMIAVVLIVAILHCVYGFAQEIRTRDTTRRRALVVQSGCTGLFLGLCILACFTAFFRDGELTVSAVSAVLMVLFFVVLGVTVGVYVGSFWICKKGVRSLVLPAVVAVLATLAMYIGEMCLLSGHLYRLGTGWLFAGLPGIVLAPVDLGVLLLAGGISAGICWFLRRSGEKTGSPPPERE